MIVLSSDPETRRQHVGGVGLSTKRLSTEKNREDSNSCGRVGGQGAGWNEASYMHFGIEGIETDVDTPFLVQQEYPPAV